MKLQRPSISSSTQYYKDTDNNNIGASSTTTITDYVLNGDKDENDTPITDLVGFFSEIVDATKDGSISLSHDGSTYDGNIQSLSASPESDFVNKLIYTITIESSREVYSVYGGTIQSGYVTSLNSTSTWDTPYDLTGVILPHNGKQYYNKPITYTLNIQGQFGSNETAEKFLKEQDFPPDVLSYRSGKVSSIRKSAGKDGSLSFTAVALYVPSGAEDDILISEEITTSYNALENYTDRTYKLTCRPMQGSLDFENSSTGPAFKVTEFPFPGVGSIIDDLMEYMITNSGIVTNSVSSPDKSYACQITEPQITESKCWNTKSLIREYNSDNSVTLTVQQTTQNIGNCDLNGYKIDYNIVTKDEDVYVEPNNWVYTGYIVQNLNASKQTSYEYTIDVESHYKCGFGTGLINIAQNKFNDIDIFGTDGTITSRVASVSNNKCSLKITQYSGTIQ